MVWGAVVFLVLRGQTDHLLRLVLGKEGKLLEQGGDRGGDGDSCLADLYHRVQVLPAEIGGVSGDQARELS